jgi:cyclin-dependent kinase 8/11
MQEGDGVSVTAIREVLLLRELNHDNIVGLHSVHVSRPLATDPPGTPPTLWLAFEYADHDLYEMIRFHREHRENRRENPTGVVNT